MAWMRHGRQRILDEPSARCNLLTPTLTAMPIPRPVALILPVIVVLAFAACTPAPKESQISGATQGTTYHIKFVHSAAIDTVALQSAVDKTLADIDLQMSNWREDSEISRINRAHTRDWIPASQEILALIRIAREVHAKSAGCYDLTIKPLVEIWGFFQHEGRVPGEREITKARRNVGMALLETDEAGSRLRKKRPETAIDLSSIGQGYSIGVVAGLLESQGIANYLVEIGGEMKVRGRKADGQPWRVAIEKPLPDQRAIQRVVAIPPEKPLAVMTSGGYRNFFASGGKVYSHIVDPRSGRPVEHRLLSVSVLHDDPAWADAWSTALQCLGEQEGLQVAEREQIKALFIVGAPDLSLREIPSSRLAADPLMQSRQP